MSSARQLLIILLLITLALIFLTGEISSPFFFLLYFLTFAVAFFFNPKIVFVVTAGLIILLFPSSLKTDLTRNLIMLFSLFLLSPIAFFLGSDYQQKRKAKTMIRNMKKKAKIIEEEIADVLRDNKQILNKRTANKLSETLAALLLLVACYLLLAPAAQAQTMSNKDYKIKMQGFNSISGTTNNADYNIRSTAGELSPIVSEGVNFKVRTGTENIASSLPFSVSLSSEIIDFGSLTPTNPIVRTLDLNIYSLSAYGYSILAYENHPLQSENANIPDTTCDNGECSHESAKEWINTLTYGFGYRCDNVIGVDCDSSFSNAEGTPSGPNFYKHFADGSNRQAEQSVMSGIGSKNKQARMSYRVNIAGNQAEGIYSNIVTYIAVPSF